jgi:flavorubredoxin
MGPREIQPGVHWVGAVDWDRRLFDALIPLPDGTTYNAYLVKGSEKTALIDTVDPTMSLTLFENLSGLGVDRIDYVVCNHAEQDHSGTIPEVLATHPEATLLASPKCQDMLADLLLIDRDRVTVVVDRQTVSLGDRTLEFVHTPWVHWPETMSTYLREDRILFPCDLFGSHLASSELFVADEARVHEAAKRYFGEIMMPFRPNIRRNLEALETCPADIIASSHGPVYGDPSFIVDAYREWSSEEPRDFVMVPFVSMHGSTLKMVERLVGCLTERGIAVQSFDLTVTDLGKLAMALVDAATIIMATPTVLVGPHPAVAHAAMLVNALRPRARFAGVIGSFGWGSKAVERLVALLPNLKVEMLEPVLSRGFPGREDSEALDRLADTIAAKHKESGFPPPAEARFSAGR